MIVMRFGWLTQQKNFIEFTAEAHYKTKELLHETTVPRIVNQIMELNEHKKGVGHTTGSIALQALAELNE